MSAIKNIKLNIHSHIDNLDDFGIASGAPEINDNEYTGVMRYAKDEIAISYEEVTEGGKIFCDILKKGDKVTVSRRGAIKSVLLFEEGKTYSGSYEIPPYKFDISVKTKRLKSTLREEIINECGGVLDILYSMNIGGAEKRCRMKISVGDAS